MPIDRSLLEPVRPGFDPELLEWARGVSQQNAEKDRHRRTGSVSAKSLRPGSKML